MPGCATTSGCSAASSATRCASRRARRSSSSSSASARPRSASTATTTSRRGASSRRMLNGLSRDADHRDHPRLQLLLAPRQYRRGPAPHPPHARPCARRASSAARRHAAHALARAPRGRHRARRSCSRSSPRRSICPVLTAHPTEVQRKSTLDREMEIAAAARRARPHALTPRGRARERRALRRAVLHAVADAACCAGPS